MRIPAVAFFVLLCLSGCAAKPAAEIPEPEPGMQLVECKPSEICETQNGEQFHRDDPASTGPNIMPWSEWEYYQITGEEARLKKIFYPLLAYHKWLQLNRTWRDGSYWSTGLACGMDNQPRVQEGYSDHTSHGHAVWVDTCIHMVMSARILIEMGKIIGTEKDTDWLYEEAERLKFPEGTRLCIVSQTTFNYNKFQVLVEIILKKSYDSIVVNTICSATHERQAEARKLASKIDVMLVIGGKHSSNTQKLYEICRKECNNTYYIQTIRDLQKEWLEGRRSVGITAGASTPNHIIEEVQRNVRIKF